MKTADTFARRLRDLRKAMGISIYALAQKSGISRQYLGDLERGTKEPSLEVARKIATALGHKLDCWDAGRAMTGGGDSGIKPEG